MSLIENLLRVRRRRCEERRRYLAELEHLAQRLRADALRLRAVIEAAAAAGDRVSAQPPTRRHAKLERSLAAVEHQIGLAGAALAAAEEELRRYELVVAPRDGAGELAAIRRGRRGRRPRAAALPIIGRDRGG